MMRTVSRLVLLILLGVMPALCQFTNYTGVWPDCVVFFTLDGAGSSASFDNVDVGCTQWNVTYSNTGFSGLTLTFQEAPDAGGTPGSWVTFTGTAVVGTPAMTATTFSWFQGTGMASFTRVTLSGLTGSGSVTGVIYGWRSGSGGGSSVAVTGTVTARNQLIDGSTGSWFNEFGCTQQAAITLTAGTTEVVALSAGLRIRVCHISLSWDATVDFSLVEGTGSNCGTGTASLTGVYQDITGVALDLNSSNAPVRGSASNAVCVTQTGAANGGGVVVYARF